MRVEGLILKTYVRAVLAGLRGWEWQQRLRSYKPTLVQTHWYIIKCNNQPATDGAVMSTVWFDGFAYIAVADF